MEMNNKISPPMKSNIMNPLEIISLTNYNDNMNKNGSKIQGRRLHLPWANTADFTAKFAKDVFLWRHWASPIFQMKIPHVQQILHWKLINTSIVSYLEKNGNVFISLFIDMSTYFIGGTDNDITPAVWPAAANLNLPKFKCSGTFLCSRQQLPEHGKCSL